MYLTSVSVSVCNCVSRVSYMLSINYLRTTIRHLFCISHSRLPTSLLFPTIPYDMTASVRNIDECQECKGVVTYHEEVRARVCTHCGTVSSCNAESSLQPDPVISSACNVKSHETCPSVYSACSSITSTATKSCTNLSRTAITLANTLSFNDAHLPAYFTQLAQTVFATIKPLPRGKRLRAMASALVLIYARQHAKPVTLQEVSRVGGVSASALRAAYSKLHSHLALLIPPQLPRTYLHRFRDASVNMTTHLLSQGTSSGTLQPSSVHIWSALNSTANKVLHIAQHLWLLSGRSPLLSSATCMLFAIRAYLRDHPVAMPSVTQCATAIMHACATTSVRSLCAMYTQMAQQMAAHMSSSVQTVNARDAHAYVDTLYNKTLTQTSHINAQPLAAHKADERWHARRELLTIVKNKRTVPTHRRQEAYMLKALIKAGASDAELLTGHYDAVRCRLYDDIAPEVEDDGEPTMGDNDDALLKTPQEIFTHCVLQSTALS